MAQHQIWVPLGFALRHFSGTQLLPTLCPAEKQGEFTQQPTLPTPHLVMDLTANSPCWRDPEAPQGLCFPSPKRGHFPQRCCSENMHLKNTDILPKAQLDVLIQAEEQGKAWFWGQKTPKSAPSLLSEPWAALFCLSNVCTSQRGGGGGGSCSQGRKLAGKQRLFEQQVPSESQHRVSLSAAYHSWGH